MFRRSRQKIVAVIMAVLVLLLAGTLGVIYGSSYMEVYRKNQDMLAHHIALYGTHALPDPAPDGDGGSEEVFRLSTFYSVLLSAEGRVLQVDNVSGGYSDGTLAQIAGQVYRQEPQGTVGSLMYRHEPYGGGTLVAFMDNAVMQQSITTLFRYTLIFGSAALVPMFFLARYAARRIVEPLERSYRQQKQFISDAGHELKTPVAVVSANAEMLERQIGPNRWLTNIRHENERMGQLVVQLLELARAEQVIPEMEPVELSRLTVGEVLPFESVAFERGLQLTQDIAGDIRVMGNGPQLAQLTCILVDNAIRHSQQGGTVGISLSADKGTARLAVSNEGDPIPEEQRERLFERFYRADSARSGEDHRYGLGLAIARAIAEAHRGTVRVACRDGRVEFCVQLPLL